MIRLTIQLFLSLGLICAPVLADDVEQVERGRLPDGRAFRTDSEGTQLVDYIAELELTVEGLKRQVTSLEDELKLASSSQSPLEEKDLQPKAEFEKPSCPSCPKTEIATVSCPPTRNCPVASCPESICPAINDKSEELAALREEIATLKSQSRELASVQAELSDKDEVLRRTLNQVALLEQQVARKQVEVPQTKVLTSDIERQRTEELKASADVQRAMNLQAQQEAEVKNAEKEREKALESFRKKVLQEAAIVANLLSERDELYKQKFAQASLALKPSVAQTQSGISFEDLQKRCRIASRVRDLNDILLGLGEVKATAESDIKTVRRLEQKL